MKRTYIVISEDELLVMRVGIYNSYKEARQCIEDCIRIGKEKEYPYHEKYYLEVEIKLTKKIKIRKVKYESD